MEQEELIEWAETKKSEAEGDWEDEKYHQGYKDAMNDLIRRMKNEQR